jgi:hypothetical protein
MYVSGRGVWILPKLNRPNYVSTAHMREKLKMFDINKDVGEYKI